MLVKNIMTSEVKSCAPDTTLAAVGKLMSRSGCGIVPVVDAQDKLLGVITDRDVCLAVAINSNFRSPEKTPACDVMTKNVYTCSPDTDTGAVLNLMKSHAVRRVPVVMTDGRLTGVISIDDLVLRADSHASAAVSDEDVFDAFKAICTRATALSAKIGETLYFSEISVQGGEMNH